MRSVNVHIRQDLLHPAGPLQFGQSLPPLLRMAGLPEEIGKAIPEPNRMHEVFRTGTALRYRAVHNPHAPMLIKAFPDKVREFFYKAPNGTLYAPAEVGGNGIPLMDITNLELADAIVEEWVQLLQNGKSKLWGNRQTRETNADFVTFGQCDAEIPITDLRDHSVFKEVGSSYPNLYARFHKHLAQKLKEKLPGTRLSLMAYASYSTPPRLSNATATGRTTWNSRSAPETSPA